MSVSSIAAQSHNRLSCRLSIGCPSFVCKLEASESMPTDASSDIVFNELLNIATSPHLVFVRRSISDSQDSLLKESKQLSFVSLAARMSQDCHAYLVRRKVQAVNSVPSPALGEWFTTTKWDLQTKNEQDFLFDPCTLLIGIIKHFEQWMRTEHKLDINREEVVGIAVPFIELWEEALGGQLCGDDKERVVKDLLTLAKGS